jgi:excisionase family DNA binding protein
LHRINDVAAALGVSRQTIYRMVRRGVLTLVKIGPNSSGITDASVQRLAGSQHGS